MDKKYFILLKQHMKTGLKYLCFHHGTKDNCFKYTGSGTYWKKHITKHGTDLISTIILFESTTKDEIRDQGLKYSDLWDVVNSKDFANLVREDGSGGHEAMHTPEVRERAANTLRTRLIAGNRTKKERQKGINQSIRIKEYGFTEAELKAQKETSIRQLGKTMKERLNDPNYIDSRKGKSAKEIFGETYKGPWNKGKTVNELKGRDYIDPRCKPFIITSHLGTYKYNNEREFLSTTKISPVTLTKLKRNGKYVVKRQSNTLHIFRHGETIYYNELK
jgi:hypothetical protein